ncbi:putative transcription factor Zn, C2H2 protein [Pleurostoma richardsiae]|uniref:Transcription factor Zn, C2H2 protein n=1 Tax=Pleurostoma richardsiae TaxID=41990 RepID=A0AA38VMR1_9PEZI|nr:putative transcription factor Zn, C2H2 protein [Pleurostoma richardsiae]
MTEHATVIFEAAKACQGGLTACVKVPVLMEEEWAENRLADFNLWANGVGALATGRASLDSRLGFKPEVQRVVTNLLYLLKDIVDECYKIGIGLTDDKTTDLRRTEQAERGRSASPCLDEQERSFSPWSDGSSTDTDMSLESFPTDNRLSQVMTQTRVILNNLGRIGVAIRQSGTRARLQRADYLFNPEEHAELRDHLTVVLLFRPGTWREQLQSRKLTEVQDRLITCNLKRRNRFIYAQTHAKGLTTTSFLSVNAKRDNSGSQAKASQKTTSDVGKPDISATQEAKRQSSDQAKKQTAKTETAASALSEAFALPDISVSQAATTQVSATATKMNYPRPPPTKAETDFFKCPCCCQTLPIMISQGNRWRKHLTTDLTPYTCVLNNCPTPGKLYATKNAWKEHMLEDHPMLQYWLCFACADSKQFSSEEALVAHTRESHRNTISDDQLAVLLPACVRTVPADISSCPICPGLDGAENIGRDSLIDHIANCVHAFSLRALPWAPDASEESAEFIIASVARAQNWLITSFGMEEADEVILQRTEHMARPEQPSHYFWDNPYFEEGTGASSADDVRSLTSIERELEKLKAENESPLAYSDPQESYSNISGAVSINESEGSQYDAHEDTSAVHTRQMSYKFHWMELSESPKEEFSERDSELVGDKTGKDDAKSIDFLGQLIRLQVYLEMQEFKRDRDTLNSLNNLPKVNPPCAIDAEANVVEPSASDSYLARSVAPEERDGTRQRLRAVAGDADDLHGAPRLLHPSIMAIITEVVYAAYNILPPR